MKKIHDTNLTLGELINNINLNLYEIQNLDNIRISNDNKKDYIILVTELEPIESLKNFVNNLEIKPKNIETSYFDFYVVNISNDDLTIISLFELINSTNILKNVDDENKWSLNEKFNCYEINYINNDEDNKNLNIDNIDMKFFG